MTGPSHCRCQKGYSPVASLDMALLPAKIAPWVCDISERMQCPPDYIAAAALSGLGAVLGRKIGVAPEQQTDWFEVANNWCCIVGRPGDLKSPAIGEALKPLHRLEVDARKAFDADVEAYEKDLQLWKLRRDAAEAKAKRDLRTNPDATIQFDAPEPPEPTERRYVTNDTSYEKLGEILAENPNGILAHRDELVSLLKTLDREEFAAARGFFLTAWNGKDRYTFDRIMRGKTYIEAACVSLLGSTQPGRLAEYVRRAISGGVGDDGLIQRFGLLVWPDQSPAWENIDRYPNSEARNAAWECFAGFDSLDPGVIGAEPTSTFQSVPVLRLDGEAHHLFLEWRTDLERNLRSGDLHPALASHLAKYRKLVPTLALINHLADAGHGLIGKDAMMRALGLATYLETHAKRAYGAGPEAETAAAKAILTHIRKGNLADGFTARLVHPRGWSNLSDRGQVQAGLDLLCDLDWIVAVETGNQGRGRPTTHYRINPRALR
jgi:putative DNA primase/helicase